ncbi:MAG: maturase, partial [Egibacteraceae bacterium]
ANDVWRLKSLQWDAQTSMLKTLAAKHKSTVGKMAAKHRAKTQTPQGLRTCIEARVERPGKPALVARFGGIPLTRNKDTVLVDHVPKQLTYPRKELVARLLTRRCELCGEPGKVLVHQVRKLASLGKPNTGQPAWAALMARKRRKTLVVCRPCHDAIHGGPAANTA